MEADLRALLISDVTLVGLVPSASIIWNHLAQATPRPAIVLYRISGAPGIHMQGSDGLLGATVQIDVHALSVTSMWAIRDELLTLLHGHKDGTFRGIFMRSERQSSELLDGGGLLHRSSMDFEVWASA